MYRVRNENVFLIKLISLTESFSYTGENLGSSSLHYSRTGSMRPNSHTKMQTVFYGKEREYFQANFGPHKNLIK